MSKFSFVEGVRVYYKEFSGVIRFVCEQYITICIRNFPETRVRDVCLIVYPQDYHLVQIEKASTK